MRRTRSRSWVGVRSRGGRDHSSASTARAVCGSQPSTWSSTTRACPSEIRPASRAARVEGSWSSSVSAWNTRVSPVRGATRARVATSIATDSDTSSPRPAPRAVACRARRYSAVSR